ncbi:MAG: hypothetical protein Q9O62_04625 [Ardenticatenia bacterium]|nr:hypothetical protein [Ardenticatenia bacterium]
MRRVRIEAPARLHLGMLDLGASLGRRFGGIGVAITRPAVVLEASPQRELTAEGPDAERAVQFARRYLRAAGIQAGAHLRVEQTIPAHVGLGSGTKLGLAVARALAMLYDQHPDDPYTLAQMVGRGRRSAVGLWTFARGGLVVEGGRRPGHDAPAPLRSAVTVGRGIMAGATPCSTTGLHLGRLRSGPAPALACGSSGADRKAIGRAPGAAS